VATFRLERDMTAVVESWMGSRELAVKAEFATPWGICDLVGVRLNKHMVRKRMALGQWEPIGPASRIALLQQVPDARMGTIAVSRLKRDFSGVMSPQQVERELERLSRARFLAEPRRGVVHRLNGWEPLHSSIVAVELKLSRIEDAYNQALCHLWFATESFVALPYDTALRLSRNPRVRRFRSNGVGILGVQADRCRVLVRPADSRRFKTNPVLQAHCVERFWRTSVRDTASSSAPPRAPASSRPLRLREGRP